MYCNRLYEVLSVASSSYTAPAVLGIIQEVEQIRANVFYSRLINVFFQRFNVFNVFYFQNVLTFVLL